ncbi:MAG TPA: HEAT repeat domain-containing protein [Vicinamibacteria bacterium]|nr:HEAT repeat domain-containing protein [Vicinamibacteria bacterium]
MTFLILGLLLAAPPSPPPLPPRMVRLGRILAAEDRRDLTTDVKVGLADADRSIRRRSALAAGRIGDPAAVPALIPLLQDGEREVRQMAAFALGLVGDALAVEALVAALEDPEPVVRGRAAEALGLIGDARAAPAVAQMVLAALPPKAPLVTVRGDDPASMVDPWLEPRLGLFALARLKDARSAEAVLLAAGKPRFDWWAATWTAMRLELAALRPVLLAAVASTDPLSRAYGARGLGALADPASLEALLPLLRDRDETVVVNAVRAVALLGQARAVPAVSALLRSPSSALRVEALKALSVLPPDRGLRERVVAEVGSPEPWVRAAALQALARMEGAEFALVLANLDPDPVWFVRAGLAAALAIAGDEASQARLLAMLEDEDARVLPAVLEALRVSRGPDSVHTLKRHLGHPDFAVRMAAADQLAALKVTGLGEELAASLARARGDVEMDARLSLVGLLAQQEDARSLALLREVAQGDRARPVREKALQALRARGEPLPAPGPEPVARPALDYREALAPYELGADARVFTPRVFLHTRHGKVEIHLNVVEAPLMSAAFLDLVRRGYYDGLTFHRVVPGFVVQGGDPRGDGNGGPGFALRDELGQRPYGRGVVGMALAGKDTGGSQLFITLSPAPHLDARYTVFGWVASGMEAVDKLRPGDVIERVEAWTGR